MATSAKRPLKHRHAHRRWDSKQASIWRRLPLCHSMVSTIFVQWGWDLALGAIGAHLVPIAISLTDDPPARSPAAVIAAPGAATGDPAIAPATVAGEAITGDEAATAPGGANTPAAASPTPQMKIHPGARGPPNVPGWDLITSLPSRVAMGPILTHREALGPHWDVHLSGCSDSPPVPGEPAEGGSMPATAACGATTPTGWRQPHTSDDDP